MTTSTKQQTTDFNWDIADGSNQDYQDVYPRIQWQHGKKQFAKIGGLVHTGGLFIPADQFPNFTAEGWAEDSFTSSKNEEIKGYYTTKASLAIIRVKTWWSEFEDGKKSSQTHMLCCVKGVDGVFSLQVGGISKGRPMNQAFADHRNQIVSMVNRTKPEGANSFEPYALWFVVEPGPHDAQVSQKEGSKSSEVTRPQLATPEKVDLEYARTLWVGQENYKLFSQIYKDTAGWQTQFPTPKTDDHHEPEYSGNGMTEGQSQIIADLLGVKGVDENGLKEIILSATNGGSNNFRTLTRDEAVSVIDTLKVL